MKLGSAFILFAGLAWAISAHAAEYQRNVDVEWEAIEGASAYDVEFSPENKGEGQNGKPITHKIKTASFTGKMIPGEYKMRVRARDNRGVPGDWSPFQEFKVQLENIKLISPKSDDSIFTQQEATYPVDFRWAPLGGALSYRFELYSNDKITQISQTVEGTSLHLNLPVAQKYTWKVTGLHKTLESEATSVDQFTLLAKKLDPPVPQKQANKYVRDLQWSEPNYADYYSFRLSRWDAQTKTWERIVGDSDFRPNGFAFDPTWPGGRYRLSLKAKGNMRESSDLVTYEFPVRDGDRSPAQELTNSVRQSIDRTSGFFATASYYISTVQYQGTNADKNSALTYSAMGGTGRVGLGYLSSYSPWGFLAIADYSGFTIGQTNYTFATVEVNGLHREASGDRGESRHQFGFFYKELPETVGNNASTLSSTSQIKGLGPHYGYEYWYALTDKIGMQANAHVYPTLFKVQTPNGMRMAPRITYQVGLLGSYRLKKDVTGLMGYAFRHDEMAYSADPNSPLAPNPSDTNEVRIEGHYLNFLIEWAL